MKRIVSFVLSVIMIISMLSTFSVQFVFASAQTNYTDLVTPGTSVYANTMVVNTSWTEADLAAGKTLKYWFRGVEYSETYDATRHFNTFANAQTAFQNGKSADALAKTVPNYILNGTFKEDFFVYYSANIYGANAGITPNDPNFKAGKAAPNAEWGENSAWDKTHETKITKKSGNTVTWISNATQISYMQNAGVSPVLNIDGVTYDKSQGTMYGVFLKHRGNHQLTFTVNIKNSVLDCHNIVTANDTSGSASKGFYDVNLDNVRVNSLAAKAFDKNLRNVTVNNTLFKNVASGNADALIWAPSTASDYYPSTSSVQRSASWTFTNSVFAGNSSTGPTYLAKFTDDAVLNSISFKFENNLFQNASTATDGVFKFGAYSNSDSPKPSIEFKGNTFYNNLGEKTSVIAADGDTLKGAYNLTFTNNRVIGYNTVYPQLLDSMDSFLSNCQWTFNQNYFAKSYQSSADKLGQLPAFINTTATNLPVNQNNAAAWYLDYNMTQTNEPLLLGDANFINESAILDYKLNQAAQTVFVNVANGMGVTNLSFKANASGNSAKVYKDALCTTEISAVTAAQIEQAGGTFTAYAVVTYGELKRTYTITLSSRQLTSITEYSDPTGAIKAGFGVLIPAGTQLLGGKYEIKWQGNEYSVPSNMAFSSVASAIDAGFTQLIMPSGNYADVQISGSIELFGNQFGKNPNVVTGDRVDNWTENPDWAINKSSVTKVTVTADAVGAKIIIDGIELTDVFNDTARAASNKKTEIIVKNALITKSDTTNVNSFNLANANSTVATMASNTNTDSFTLLNGRVVYGLVNANLYFFSSNIPATLTVEGTYFGEKFPNIGILDQPITTKNGSINLINNYFYKYGMGSAHFAMRLRGVGKTKDVVRLGHIDILNISGNVVVDCINNPNSNASQKIRGVFEIMADGFSQVNFTNNTIISTANAYYDVIRNTSLVSSFATANADYSNRLNMTGNRMIGTSQYLTYSNGTTTAKYADGNYHAPYTADFKNGTNGEKLFGVLAGADYYLDYNKTVLASDFDIYTNADGVSYNHDARKMSIIIADDSVAAAQFTNKNGDITYTVYGDKDCSRALSTVKADKTYWAKATKNGVSVVYEIYVTKGNATAPEYSGSAYLLSDKVGSLPVGAKISETYNGQDYIFTVGKNAFASVSQITYAHALSGKTTTPDVIMASGVHKGGYKLTGSINVIGDNTVLKADFNKGPVKIATIGDSVTEGTGHDYDPATKKQTYDDGKTYPEHLQDKLDAAYGEGNYVVKNFGKENSAATPVNSTISLVSGKGFTRSQYIRGTWYYSARDYAPDVVVIMLGYNDTDTTNKTYLGGKVYEQHLREIIDNVRALPSNPQIILSGTHYTYALQHRENMIEHVITGIQKQLAKEYGAILVDNDSVTKDLVKNDYYLDNVHLHSVGYEIMAQNIKDSTAALYSSEKTVTTTGVTVNTNANLAEPLPRIKVAAIGDDLSYGVKAYTGYYKHLQDLLGQNYEVRNYAEPQSTVVDGATCYKIYDSSYGDIADYPSSKAWKPNIAIFSFGKNDTAGDEFKDAYVNLIKEYENAGAKIYITTVLNTAVNADIKEIAEQNGWTLIDLYEQAKDWDISMFLDSNKQLFSDAGSKAVAKVVRDNISYAEFSQYYSDPVNQITNDAVVVDYELDASTLQNGDKLTYAWDGAPYIFEYGTNAFANINDALKAAKNGKLQVLIPANNVVTGGSAFSIANTADAKNITSLEVFGVNRGINPNDKSASANDPTADWTLSTNWGVHGESGVGQIIIETEGENSLSGKLTFDGITMRDSFVDTKREGSADQSLDITLKNIVVKTTATASDRLINDSCTGRTGIENSTDSLSLVNFRVEYFHGKSGAKNILGSSSSKVGLAHTTLDNFYIKAANTTAVVMGYLRGSASYKNTSATVINSQFRGFGGIYFAPSASNIVDGDDKTATVTVSNNVFYDANYQNFAIQLVTTQFTSAVVSGNYFVDTTDTSAPIKSQSAAKGYTLTNNTFIVKDVTKPLAAQAALPYGAPAGSINVTGNYLAPYVVGYQNGASNINPTTINAAYTADYYYIDFVRTVKNTDLQINKVNFADAVVNSQNKTITANIQKLVVLNNLGVECVSKKITSKFFVEGNEITSLDLRNKSGIVSGTIKLYLNDVAVDEYAVTLSLPDVKAFNAGDHGEIKKDAVAVIDSVANSSNGAKVYAYWQGESYEFTANVNAFATVADALASGASQIIIPGGQVVEINVNRSVTIYGENYNVSPWVANGNDVEKSANWGAYGESVATDIVIGAQASGTTIQIKGLNIIGQVTDTARGVSSAKTKITLENNILERNTVIDGVAFDLGNQNNKNQNGENTDEFTIKNMLFVNNVPSADSTLFADAVPAYFTIDGFACNGNMQSFGKPQWYGAVKAGKVTFTNNFVKDINANSSANQFVAEFMGHKSGILANSRDEMNLTLQITNNTIIDCTPEKSELGAINIYPGSFKDITIEGNTFISTDDHSTRIIGWMSDTNISKNDKDFTSKILFNKNRVMGYLAAVYVNDKTTVDLSGNYFETTVGVHQVGAPGDTPADTDANVYIDYELTTKLFDMRPTSNAIAGLKVIDNIHTVYGYAANNVLAFDFENANGVSYKVYSDADCQNQITSLSVALGQASKAYIKATKGEIELVYTLYVMGVKDTADVASASTVIDGISEPALYYPSLYAQPNGIEVITYYNNKPVKFTTGKNVVTSQAQFGVFGDDIVLPDDVSDVSFELLTKVNLYSAFANITNLTTRKVKIACVGDSITYGRLEIEGEGVTDAHAYPYMMQNLLGTDNYEVGKFGKSGATATDSINYKGEQLHYPKWAGQTYKDSIAFNGDVIIIGIGTNDARDNLWTSNDRYINEYVELIRRYQALDSKPTVYITTVTECYEKNQPQATFNASENLRHIQQVVASITGAQIIDAHTLMADMFDKTDRTFSYDGLHPNKDGYKLYGERIGTELLKTYTGVKDSTITLNGVDVSGEINFSHENVSLEIKGGTINATTPVINPNNITSLVFDNVIVTKDGKTLSRVDIGNIISSATLQGESYIDMTKAQKDYTVVVGDKTIPLTVTNDDPVAIFAALVDTVRYINNNDGRYCEGLYREFDEARKLDPTTLTTEQALDAIAKINALGTHSFTNRPSQNVHTEANCQSAALHYVQCDKCDVVSTDKTVAFGEPESHVLQDVEARPGNCTEAGYNAHKACKYCDYTEGKVEIPASHVFSVVEGKAPTCTEHGYTSYNDCDFCDVIEGKTIIPASHKLVPVAGKDATCDEDGHTAYVDCEICDYTEGYRVLNKGHKLVSVDAKDATCTEDGHSEYRYCQECDFVSDYDIYQANHSFKDVEGKDATCYENGYTSHKVCEKCGHTDGKTVINAGHNFVNIGAKDEACTEDGHNAHKYCQKCGYTEGKTVIPAGHKLVEVAGKDATCTENGYTSYRYCLRCDYTENYKIIHAGHNWSEFVYNNDATVDADGTKTRVCSVCGKSETVVMVGTKLPTANKKPIIDTSSIFTDSVSSWAKQYIDYAYTYGIFNGKGEGKFEPNTNITRAEFVQVLANLSGFDTTNKSVVTKFADVKSGQWYAPAVKWASENGIVKGLSATNFAPNKKITREQMCVMLVRYASYNGVTLKAKLQISTFADDSKISSWAKDAVYTCQMAGIVNGKGNNKFDPQGTGTRAEAATIFARFHQEYFA